MSNGKDTKVFFLERIYKAIPLFALIMTIAGTVMIFLAMRHVENADQEKMIIIAMAAVFYLPSLVLYLIRIFYLKGKIISIKSKRE